MKTAVGICFRNLLQVRFLLLAAVFFLFVSSSWAGCDNGSFNFSTVAVTGGCKLWSGTGIYCYNGDCSSRPDLVNNSGPCANCDACNVESITAGNYTYFDCSCTNPTSGTCETKASNGSLSRYCHTRCTNGCSADSLRCVKAGDWWDSANCSCSSICGTLESKCTRAGGKFTGRALNLGEGQACCSAICDQCNTEANEKIVALKKKYCCDAGFAPPAEGDNCYSPPGISGCGMTTLQRMTSTLDYQCRDPNSSEEAANAYYDQCFPGSSSSGEGGSSSSGEGGSSSSGEGGSSSGGSNYPEGCDECPWLDSILDTLTLLKWNSDDMLQCIVNPSVCTTSPDEQGTQVDSVILEGVKERLDSVVARLRSNDTGLRKLDTSILKLLDSLGKSIRQDSLKRRFDSAMAVAGLKNDTMIRNAIADAGASVDGNLVKLRNTTDTNLVKLRDGVFELDTGMKHHLDSIIAHLPDTILDSIRKYQDSTLDRIDTALFGAGVGFSLVDSMIDTVVKYFRVSNHYDSVYNRMFASFDSTFKYKMENLEMSIESDYSALGYGDTATSTLRKDLESLGYTIQDLARCGTGQGDTSNICNELRSLSSALTSSVENLDSSINRELRSLSVAVTSTIENLDSSVNHELKSLVDEQKSFYSSATGYGDGTSTLKGDLDGIRQAIEGLQFGEGSGVISAFDSAINANGGGRVDTNGIYLPIYGGDSLADSIGRDVGYGGINVGRDTSAMDSLERLGVEESDSTICVGSECVKFDSDRKISDSLNRYISQQGDSIRMSNQAFYRDSVDKMFQDVKDTLTKWNPFGMFDSTLMKTLGAKVPNTNTCPEHCTKFAIPIPFSFGPLSLDLDWNLCHPWLVLGSKDVMSFLRFIIRIIVAVTCIGMVMQAAANTKIK